MVDEDFKRFLTKALDTWEKGSEAQSAALINQAVDYMKTAIRELGKPSSRLQGLLALMEYELVIVCANSGDKNLVRMANTYAQEAQRAAEQAVEISTGLELRGYLVLMYLKADQLLELDPDLGALNPMGSGGILGALFSAINTGVDAVRVRNSHKAFDESLTTLLAAFSKLFSEYHVEVEEFLFISDRLLAATPLLDQLKKTALARGIYTAILNINTEALSFEGLDEDEKKTACQGIQEIRDLARARLGI